MTFSPRIQSYINTSGKEVAIQRFAQIEAYVDNYNKQVNGVVDEKQAKLMIIQDEITSLQRYIGRSDDIIPHEMKNTIEIVNEQAPQTTQTQAQTKNKFDM